MDIPLSRLLLGCAALSTLTWLAVGGLQPLWIGQALALAAFCSVAAALALVLHLVASLARLRRHVRDGRVDVAALWRGYRPWADAALCAGLVSAVQVANVGVVHLAELHRASVKVWYDGALWALEQPLFAALLPLRPGPWEQVYHAMWLYVIGVLCALVVFGRRAQAVRMTMVATALFYLTQLIALVWPTAGPAAYRPEMFEFLRESLSWRLQQMLLAYQAGTLEQNGLLYGMVAMPSMHVALTALAGLQLAALHRAGWVPALAMLLLTWTATLVLGWHYALDGVVGIAMAVACHALTRGSWRPAAGRASPA